MKMKKVKSNHKNKYLITIVLKPKRYQFKNQNTSIVSSKKEARQFSDFSNITLAKTTLCFR